MYLQGNGLYGFKTMWITFDQRSLKVSENFKDFNLNIIVILSTFPEDCSGKGSVVFE